MNPVFLLLVSTFISAVFSQTKRTSFTFTPENTITSFGEVSLLKGSVKSRKDNSQYWYLPQPSNDKDLQMALRARIIAGEHCSINDIDVTFNVAPQTKESDAAIIISAGDEFISMLFDADGGILIDNAPQRVYGGFAMYPKCQSNTLGKIKDQKNDANYMFTSFDDSQTKQNIAYDWRDILAGGNRDNWNVIRGKNQPLSKRSQYIIGYKNDQINNKLNVQFTAKKAKKTDVVINCEFDTTFSFIHGKDVNVYFTPDYTDEKWIVNSIEVETDCSVDTSAPTLVPTEEPECDNACNDGIFACKHSKNTFDENKFGCNHDENIYCKEFDNINGGCKKCENGYFMKSKHHLCVSCDETIEGCLECSDFLGCIKCDECNDYKYYFDKKCNIGRCMTNDEFEMWFRAAH